MYVSQTARKSIVTSSVPSAAPASPAPPAAPPAPPSAPPVAPVAAAALHTASADPQPNQQDADPVAPSPEPTDLPRCLGCGFEHPDNRVVRHHVMAEVGYFPYK